MSPIKQLSPPAVLSASVSAVTRGQTLSITPFLCVSVLKCEGFVNAPILLWQGFYLTHTSRRHSLFWSYHCSPQHSSGQLYLFSLSFAVLTLLHGPGKPLVFSLKFMYHKHIIKVILCFKNVMGKHNSTVPTLVKKEHCSNENIALFCISSDPQLQKKKRYL